MLLTIFTSGSAGSAQNCLYPNKHKVTDVDAFKKAVSFDHVSADYKNHYRSHANFIESDHISMDCDNERSDKPEDWISPKDILQIFDGVSLAIASSRNHERQKGTKSARPRYHVYFPIEKTSNAESYKKLKEEIAETYPFFDNKALDSARFMFGNPSSEIYWQEGAVYISDFLNDSFADWDEEQSLIPEGSRNQTLSLYVGRIIVRLGATEEAYQMFINKAALCNPPLEEEELKRIWQSAKRFGKKVAEQDDYITPDEYGHDFALRPRDFSDVGQAKVLSEQYGDILRYSPATNFLYYNGSFWEESEPAAQDLAQDLTDRQLEEAEKAIDRSMQEMQKNGVANVLFTLGANKAQNSFDSKQMQSFRKFQAAEAYRKYIIKRRDSRNIASGLKEVRPMVLLDPKILDANAFLLNTPSATYDLRKGSAVPLKHNPLDFISKQTAVDPSDDGMEIWLAALEIFFQGDNKLIDYVQQVVGLAAIGKILMEAMIIAYGDGRNGKSTFWNAILRVLGTYSGNISADVLTVGCKRNVKPELAEVRGRRLIIAAELEEGMRLNTSVVKQLCSTDDIYAEKKYKDPFSYTPTHTLVLYTNHLPKVGALDNGTWRRLIVIPFEAVIDSKRDVKNYADHLFKEAGGAILTWIVAGAGKVILDNFELTLSDKVKSAIDRYKESNNWLQHFFNECCLLDPSYEEKSGELYADYRAFCLRTGDYTRSTSDFYTALEGEGFIRRKTNKGNFVSGIKLKSDFETV
ncbi:MAG TPA: phage/plasmid primase, P4 family [Oscillospiraceae bacterium]|nr:phage/plasmid primase, P4 family [Oscillospiraceae bacterium]